MSRIETADPPKAASRDLVIPLVSIYCAFVLVGLDGAIVNVALPTLSQALHATSAASVAVATSYQLAVVMFLLPFAALGESLGPQRVFRVGVALFIAASGVCALASTLPMLVAARFAQGVGGAAIMALVAMLLRFTMPPDKLAGAIGWNAVTVALSGALGPSVGALILSVAGWPWLFAVNLPVGAVALWASRALPAVNGTGRRVDLVSAATSAAAFAMFFAGANRVFETPPLGLALLAAAAAFIFWLVRRERGRASPLAPVDLFVSADVQPHGVRLGLHFRRASDGQCRAAVPCSSSALGADVVRMSAFT